jgi:hypothetical protein
MSKVFSFKIDTSSKLYYNMKDLNIISPEFFYGCKTKPRTIIQKKKIPTTEYVYANLKKNEWSITTEECKKAQLLVTKDWADKYFFTTIKRNNDTEIKECQEIQNISEKDINLQNIIENNTNENINDDICENAPPKFFLRDDEKFKDINGNTIEIETLGTHERNKIFFKVKDVMDGFNLNSLDKVLLDTRYNYKRNTHYKTFFIRETLGNHELPTIKKCLYLTYKGILKVLFSSRSGNAENFQDWAEEKLFTIQMGSKEEKQKLGTQLLKVDLKTFKAVFDSYASTFPCIYLISLGKVKDLRETFNISPEISDKMTVYKYGFTEDLERRLKEHNLDYGKMKNVNINLSVFHMIDAKYISKAENDISNLFETFGKKLIVNENELTQQKRKELVFFDEKEYKQITEHYKLIGLKYIGSTQYLQDKVQELQNEIKILNLNRELDVQKLVNENELLKKDLEKSYELFEAHKKIYELEKKTLELEIKLLQSKK